MKIKLDTVCDKVDSFSSKVLFLEHNLVSIKQDSEFNSTAQSSLKDSFKQCTDELSNIKSSMNQFSSPDLFPHHSSIVIHNMPIRDNNTVTRYTTYLLNTELSLIDIHIKKTKVITSHTNKKIVFVELECANQKSKVLKNKHLLKNKLLLLCSTPLLLILERNPN